MKATEQLRAEHEGVKLMLRILEEVCHRLETEGDLDSGDPGRIAEFLSVFVDKCHHGKEEDLLFPALEAAGVPKEGGPIGVMLAEHTEGRGYIRGMKEALEGLPAGDAAARSAFIGNSRGYIGLLTQHIEKEGDILFAMADSCLSAEQQDDLFEGFETIEIERIGLGKHEEFHALMDRLAERYL